MGIFSNLFSGNILYYPGCSTKFVAKDVEKKYKSLLDKMNIEYLMLSDLEKCCGSPILNAGYEEEFISLAKENLRIFKEHGISKIITNCPGCYLHFKKIYPEYLGDDWDVEVQYFLLELLEQYKKGKIKFKKHSGTVTYHDPCHLGRAMGIYDEAREILRLSSYKVVEMELNKEYALCCGAGGTVNINESELSNKMAQERLEMAEKTGADFITSPCVLCTHQLSSNKTESQLDTIEFSKLIDIE